MTRATPPKRRTLNKLAGDNSVLAVLGRRSPRPPRPLPCWRPVEAPGDAAATRFHRHWRLPVPHLLQFLPRIAEFAAETLKVKKVAALRHRRRTLRRGRPFAAAPEAGQTWLTRRIPPAPTIPVFFAAAEDLASGAEFLYAPYYYSVARTSSAGPRARLQGHVMGPDGYDKLTGDKSQYDNCCTTHFA